MIVEVAARKLISVREMGYIRFALLGTYEDDDEIGWERRWLRQVIVPRSLPQMRGMLSDARARRAERR